MVKSCRRVIGVLSFFSIVVLGEANPEMGKLDSFWGSNIVCVVSGYQVNRIVGGECEVPRFFSEGEIKEKGYPVSGFLFYVVFPRNLRGSYFFSHHDGELASGTAYNLYQEDQFYLFPYGVSQESAVKVVTTADLYRLIPEAATLCSINPLGERWFFSKTEALAHIQKIEKDLSSKRKEVEGSVNLGKTYLDKFHLQQTKVLMQNLEREKERIRQNIRIIEWGKKDCE